MARVASLPQAEREDQGALLATLGGLAALKPARASAPLEAIEPLEPAGALTPGETAARLSLADSSPAGSPPRETGIAAFDASIREAAAPSRQAPVRDRPALGPKRRLLLVVVRGATSGREYPLVIEGKVVVGSHADCDCVLEEGDLAAQRQFELMTTPAGVQCRNLSKRDPTLINGFAIQGSTAVESGDLIGNGRMILRAVLL